MIALLLFLSFSRFVCLSHFICMQILHNINTANLFVCFHLNKVQQKKKVGIKSERDEAKSITLDYIIKTLCVDVAEEDRRRIQFTKKIPE